MIKFYSLNKGVYHIKANDYNVSFVGKTAYDNAYEALKALGVAPTEIHFALSEMTRKSHNVADFGINKMLTFTSSLMN